MEDSSKRPATRDTFVDVMLLALFGGGGIAILLVVWAQPMSLAERVPATLVASAGLLWMSIRTAVMVRARLHARSRHA